MRPGGESGSVEKRRAADVAAVDADDGAHAIGRDGQLRQPRFEEADLGLDLLAPAERDLVGAVAQVLRSASIASSGRPSAICAWPML